MYIYTLECIGENQVDINLNFIHSNSLDGIDGLWLKMCPFFTLFQLSYILPFGSDKINFKAERMFTPKMSYRYRLQSGVRCMFDNMEKKNKTKTNNPIEPLERMMKKPTYPIRCWRPGQPHRIFFLKIWFKNFNEGGGRLYIYIYHQERLSKQMEIWKSKRGGKRKIKKGKTGWSSSSFLLCSMGRWAACEHLFLVN